MGTRARKGSKRELLKRINGIVRVSLAWLGVPLILIGGASEVKAYKVTTHMVAAQKAAELLPDSPLKTTLLGNMQYLRAGAVGPDVFYASVYLAHYSDLAHYCKTDALATAMLAGAGGDAQLKAFALGWYSHNVQDSVAHPWVNGFVGGSFSLGFPGFNTAEPHGAIEAWVNEQVLSQFPLSEGPFGLTVVNSIGQYAFDRRIQNLVAAGFNNTYGNCLPPIGWSFGPQVALECG